MGGALDGSGRRRAFVEDARRNGQFLRITWHRDRQQFVVSNWDGTVCVGATRVGVEDAPALIDVVARGLADAAVDGRAPVEVPAPAPRSLLDHLRAWWRERTPRLGVGSAREVHHQPVRRAGGPAPDPALGLRCHELGVIVPDLVTRGRVNGMGRAGMAAFVLV